MRATRHRISAAAQKLQQLQHRLLLESPRHVIQQHSLRQTALLHRLQQGLRQTLRDKQAQLAQLARSLDSVSPLSTLQRGYSITFDAQGQVLRDTRSLQIGATISTRLHDGMLRSTVTELLVSENQTAK